MFQHFALWAGYEERAREGHKFVVAERQVKHGAETEADMDLQHQRRIAREAIAQTQDIDVMADLFDES